MKRYELDGLKEGYKIVDPIVVKEQRFMENNDIYVCLTVVGLENELIFGFARRFSVAKRMLVDAIVDYYECLVKASTLEDKERDLVRSIERESNP